ncbi:hypothetical protein B296_00056620 [Ensete ventricosum]|uniref:Uncharacterized protein n=1 Tax=Ensete ventricosum TaxID=4639 RepID=A0A426WW07_ENSVE|nr:hypothetical protein B296_00056620 [Ensete ventricosum]
MRSHAQSRVSIGFMCTVSEIQNTSHSQCISPCCKQSRVSIDFSCTVSKIQNTGQSQSISPRVEFQSGFRALSWKFKILAIPDILDHGKSYEYGFTKKCNGHKLSRSCKQSRVSIGFSCTVSEIQNTGQSQSISPRVSIGFSCTVSEIQNTGQSQCIST